MNRCMYRYEHACIYNMHLSSHITGLFHPQRNPPITKVPSKRVHRPSGPPPAHLPDRDGRSIPGSGHTRARSTPSCCPKGSCRNLLRENRNRKKTQNRGSGECACCTPLCTFSILTYVLTGKEKNKLQDSTL